MLSPDSASPDHPNESLPQRPGNGFPKNACNLPRLNRVKIVSFDIFDTLLQRLVLFPSDIFKIMEPFVFRLTDGRLRSFASARKWAERRARVRELESGGRDEVSLAGIYAALSDAGLLSLDEAAAVMREEIGRERGTIRARPAGVDLFEQAKKAGLRVILASDMYLERETVEELLRDNGIRGYDSLFLSSDLGCRKRDGRLYREILRSEGVRPGEILHIGDNPNSDIGQARRLGMRTLHLPAAREGLFADPHFKRQLKPARRGCSLWESLVLGISASRLFSSPLASTKGGSGWAGDPFALGFVGLGPLLAGFSLWLAEKTSNDGIDDLFFLSRDGHVMREAFDRIAPGLGCRTRTHYIHASRGMAGKCLLRNRADIVESVLAAPDGIAAATYLQGRLGVSASAVPAELWARRGLSPDTPVSDGEKRDRFVALCLDNADLILRAAVETRRVYAKYLDGAGFGAAERKAVVDIGYAGTMQEAFSLLDGSKVPGYYLMTFHSISRLRLAGLDASGYAHNGVNKLTAAGTLAAVNLTLEVLMTNCDGVFVGLEEGGGGEIMPVFDTAERNSRRLDVVPAVHAGALAFVDELVACVGDVLSGVSAPPEEAARALVGFFTRPGREGAAMFAGLLFSNAIADETPQYVVPPGDRRMQAHRALWRQGSRRLYPLSYAFGKVACKFKRIVNRIAGAP